MSVALSTCPTHVGISLSRDVWPVSLPLDSAVASRARDGLSGPATMAHFHGPAAEGKNGPPVIWLAEKGATVTSPIKGQATLTPEQAQQLTAGEWYVNVHTQANPNGEIRGQVMPPKS